MASKENASAKKTIVVPNFESINNHENAFSYKAVKVKKSEHKKAKFKHTDAKTISNLIDALLEIDEKVLEKLA